jgi:N-acetylglucosamine kinase-like BadF-type ATPase
MAYYMGIEGVSMRRSVAVLSDETGKILSSAKIPKPMSLHTTRRDILRTRISDLITEVLRKAHLQDSTIPETTICIGLTGVTFAYDKEVDLPGEFRKYKIFPRHLICTGDAEIIFASHAQSMVGSLLLSHMGSTAYVTNGISTRVRFGGWGPLFGDKGSGYAIGRNTLTAISEEYDRHEGTGGELWNRVKEWLMNPDPSISEWVEASLIWKEKVRQAEKNNIDPRTALFALFHEIAMKGAWDLRAVTSGLAIPLMKAWEAGCPVSDKIVRVTVNDLCDQYDGACRTAGVNPVLGPLVLYGGVLVHNKKFAQLVVHAIRSSYGCTVAPLMPGNPNTMRPACGALLFALGNCTSSTLQLPPQPIVDNLLTKQSHLHKDGDLKND